MSGKIGVFGYGAVGAATVERLAAAGRAVVVAQRQAPANLPPGVEFRRCDALDAGSVRARRSRDCPRSCWRSAFPMSARCGARPGRAR